MEEILDNKRNNYKEQKNKTLQSAKTNNILKALE